MKHYDAARFCSAVYPRDDEGPDDVDEFLDAYFTAEGFDLVTVRTDSQFAAVVRDQATHDVAVVFRGSNDAKDWALNIKAKNVRSKRFPGKIHAGFSEAFEEIVDPVKQAIAQLWDRKNQATRLSIYGHSLGGALATLLALDLNEVRFRISDVATFGSPRVGNRSFARSFDWLFGHKSTRYVNENDVVPLLPPWALTRSVHVPRLVWLTKEKQLARIPFLRYIRSWMFSRRQILGDALSDHSSRAYARKLKDA